MATSEALAVRTGRGMLWSGIETFGMSAVSIVVSILLARLVTPAAFGLIVIIQVFIALGQVFADSDISQALIRQPERTHSLDSAALYISVGMSLLCYLVLWMCAPLIADFYMQPQLIGIIRWIGLTIPLAGACVVQTSRLSSKMRFRQMAGVTLCSTLAGGVAGVFMAYKGYGVTALIVQQLTIWGTRALLLWTFFPWMPGLHLRLNEVRGLCRFSWKLLVSALIDTIYVNMYAPVIGKFFSATVTAMYWRANSLASFIPQGVQNVMCKVSLPSISAIRDDRGRTRCAYIRLIRCSCWLLFPICAIGIALANPLFCWVLTDKWVGAVPLFRILCASMALYPMHALNCTALNVYGRSDNFLRLEICKKIIGVLTLCIALPMGVIPLCYGVLLSGLINLVINICYARPYIGLGIAAQLRLMLPSILCSLSAAATAYMVSMLVSALWAKVLCGASAGMAIYLFLSIIANLRAPREIKSLFS